VSDPVAEGRLPLTADSGDGSVGDDRQKEDQASDVARRF
jgi:hypothetical protein